MLNLQELFGEDRYRLIRGDAAVLPSPPRAPSRADAPPWQRFPDPVGATQLQCRAERAKELLADCRHSIQHCTAAATSSRQALQRCRTGLEAHVTTTSAVRELLRQGCACPWLGRGVGAEEDMHTRGPADSWCTGRMRCFFCIERLALQKAGDPAVPLGGGASSGICADESCIDESDDAWFLVVSPEQRVPHSPPRRRTSRDGIGKRIRKSSRERGMPRCKPRVVVTQPNPPVNAKETWYAKFTEDPRLVGADVHSVSTPQSAQPTCRAEEKTGVIYQDMGNRGEGNAPSQADLGTRTRRNSIELEPYESAARTFWEDFLEDTVEGRGCSPLEPLEDLGDRSSDRSNNNQGDHLKDGRRRRMRRQTTLIPDSLAGSLDPSPPPVKPLESGATIVPSSLKNEPLILGDSICPPPVQEQPPVSTILSEQAGLQSVVNSQVGSSARSHHLPSADLITQPPVATIVLEPAGNAVDDVPPPPPPQVPEQFPTMLLSSTKSAGSTEAVPPQQLPERFPTILLSSTRCEEPTDEFTPPAPPAPQTPPAQSAHQFPTILGPSLDSFAIDTLGEASDAASHKQPSVIDSHIGSSARSQHLPSADLVSQPPVATIVLEPASTQEDVTAEKFGALSTQEIPNGIVEPAMPTSLETHAVHQPVSRPMPNQFTREGIQRQLTSGSSSPNVSASSSESSSASSSPRVNARDFPIITSASDQDRAQKQRRLLVSQDERSVEMRKTEQEEEAVDEQVSRKPSDESAPRKEPNNEPRYCKNEEDSGKTVEMAIETQKPSGASSGLQPAQNTDVLPRQRPVLRGTRRTRVIGHAAVARASQRSPESEITKVFREMDTGTRGRLVLWDVLDYLCDYLGFGQAEAEQFWKHTVGKSALETSDDDTMSLEAFKHGYHLLNPYMIRSRRDEVIIRKPGSLAGEGLTLDSNEDCAIYISDVTAQVFIDLCKGCSILIGPCESSVFVRDCENCTLWIAAQQLRTRDCKNCTFYLYSKTEPIIEESENLVFGPWAAEYPKCISHFSKVNFDPNRNLWNAVFDFSGKATYSNWSISPLQDVTTLVLRLPQEQDGAAPDSPSGKVTHKELCATPLSSGESCGQGVANIPQTRPSLPPAPPSGTQLRERCVSDGQPWQPNA